MDIRESIALSREFIKRHNPEMSVYVLRDLPETRAAGLTELAWELCRNDGYASNIDARYLIAKLEAYLTEVNHDAV